MQFYTKLKFTRVCLLTSMVLSALMLTGCLTTEEAKQEATIKVKKSEKQTSKPNFIVIFTDDQGYEDVGVFGGDHVATPNLDQMASEGLVLTDFYVASPLCSPSRAALMTGSYPRRINMATGSNFPVLLAGDSKGLNPSEITIAETLKEAGYITGMFGKWHLGDQPEVLPTRQGFDEFFGLPYSHDISPTHKKQARFKFPDLPLMSGETVIELNPDPANLTRRITDKAVDFIKRHKDESFFLYLPQPMPHAPLHVSKEYLATVDDNTKNRLGISDQDIKRGLKKAMYPLVIGELDSAVGRVLNTLKELELDANTIVIYTSDNGPAGKLNSDGSKRYLSGRKTLTLEGGMRVPTIAWAPGMIAANTISKEVTTSMDILPTLAAIAGAKVPADRVIDGKNIWPILTGKKDAKSPYDAFFYYRENTLEAVRSGDWKLSIKGVRPGLYNLVKDPAETHDLTKQFPNKAEQLLAHIIDFEAELGIDKTGACANCRPAAEIEDPKYIR
ncbi:sulfatase [Psychrosphaera sp. 1_MG-2023]|uniref:sulfatase family protein n=1 Tax=Psychrosphaera sp. 1_MG-2023 TaxID=3062643 RepID=UPI0026E26C85|nr:sulfatase [Psychrosphaera sp. 1_MG-2023]MDO6721354.1 sulfatase [Psychrosphaera sp. 1_MG-2023]